MTKTLRIFPPTRAAGLDRLRSFAPKAGQNYAEGRNFCISAGNSGAVFELSPYLRSGMILQSEVLRAVLSHHGAETANRFIAEVLWRSYWQGWLALRPGIWDSYQSDLQRLFNDVHTQTGLRQQWQSACLGQTGIAPFDAWAVELAQTGYLHNHARMWFASIWVHTLKLPWQLGADFFLRHLLDGCPASNTLGWKWVAGLQTIAKPYLATEENIAKFTRGQFSSVPGLAKQAVEIDAPPHRDPQLLWPTTPPDPTLRSALILHEDALHPTEALHAHPDVAAHVTLIATADQTPWKMSAQVSAFRTGAADDAKTRMAGKIGLEGPTLTDAKTLVGWAKENDIAQLITSDAPVGPTKNALDAFERLPGTPPLIRVRRPLDAAGWPLATRGFFKFRAHIPGLLQTCC